MSQTTPMPPTPPLVAPVSLPPRLDGPERPERAESIATSPPLPCEGSGIATRARRWRTGGLTAIVVAAVLSGGTGAAVATLLDDDPAAPETNGAPIARFASTLEGESLDVVGVVAAVEPSVVTIQTEVGGRLGGTGAGTGVVLTADGEILTNAHVIEGATFIRVTLAGQPQSIEARLIGADPAADLALLQLADSAGLQPATLGSSEDLAVGDDVVAIGNALALRGGPTVTRGIVSALDRSLETESNTMTGLVQTDASISSGNSGGPLVDAGGEVVGINTAVASSGGGTAAENIGFAIAIDQALPIIESLRSGEDPPAAGQLGVGVEDPADGSRGAVVAAVAPGSAAGDAGLEAGDLIVAVDDDPVDGAASLVAAVRAHVAGDAITLTVERDGAELTMPATLGTAPGR